jgi:hypothetical protein
MPCKSADRSGTCAQGSSTAGSQLRVAAANAQMRELGVAHTCTLPLHRAAADSKHALGSHNCTNKHASTPTQYKSMPASQSAKMAAYAASPIGCNIGRLQHGLV